MAGQRPGTRHQGPGAQGKDRVRGGFKILRTDRGVDAQAAHWPQLHEGVHEVGGGIGADFFGEGQQNSGVHKVFLPVRLGRVRSHASRVAPEDAEVAQGMLKIGLRITAQILRIKINRANLWQILRNAGDNHYISQSWGPAENSLGNNMNKMTKGALATGLGVALLVGGGGTLAVWNDTKAVAPGTIMAGDMTLTADTAGTWTNSQGKEMTLAQLANYKVVPGDVLTFTQPLKVLMTGDLLAAELTTDGLVEPENKYFTVGDTVLKDTSGNIVSTLTSTTNKGDYIATVSVTFDNNTDVDNGSKNVSQVLGALNFKLTQTPIPPVAD